MSCDVEDTHAVTHQRTAKRTVPVLGSCESGEPMANIDEAREPEAETRGHRHTLETPENNYIISISCAPESSATGTKRPRDQPATDSMRSQQHHKKARCEPQLPKVPPLPGEAPANGVMRVEKPSRLRYPVIEEWTSDEDDPGAAGSIPTSSTEPTSYVVASASSTPSAALRPQPPRTPTQRRSSSAADLAGTSPPRPIPLRLRADAASEKELAAQRSKERQLNRVIVAERSHQWSTDASSLPLPQANSAARLEYHRSQLVERMERTLSACRRISRKLQRTVKQPIAADSPAEPLARSTTKRKREESLNACAGGPIAQGADGQLGTFSRGGGSETFSMILIVDEESRNLERMLKRIKST
ncbi:hypothetical protein M427DRAFT_44819 [Gonapodya prolifera JEL478]|uniref:Uncharacterized protein n=1 Tax=Gonapodya prolifera (strain JEL478) TaxID=1344416 RepID=A0A139AE36_GONPJ|nr:hypothetical protein M427DRAFT_44819 [Gonapodya prolifera JEL478]|eukprot:KXS14854.1 hypothetical protein M427DRAFT_44819 [Gonapodya prolifera JEL478]